MALTENCGPHCGIKDGMEAHCERCHRLAELPLSVDKVNLTEMHLRRRLAGR
jgi:hypothetical protein